MSCEEKKNQLSKQIGKLFASNQKQEAEKVQDELAHIDKQLQDLEVVEEKNKKRIKRNHDENSKHH